MSELPRGWTMTTVGEAGKVELGMARSPARHNGPNMKPYLRVANVFEDRIDLSDVKEMHFDAAEFARYALQPDDVLLNEGQSPELLGRPALYSGDPNVYAYTNSLLRFRAGPAVLPAWALLVFRHYMHSGRFVREVRITTNIAHLSAGRFKAVEFPVPPLAEQRRLVEQVDLLSSALRGGRTNLQRSAPRVTVLRQAVRRSLLESADGRPAPLADVVERIEAGRSGGGAAPTASRDEWGVIKVSAMTWGEFDESQNKRVDSNFADPRYEIREGDLLVSRANTADYVGAPVLVGSIRPKLLLSDKSLRIVPKPGVDRRWLLHSLASPSFRSYISATATGNQDSMRNISQSALLSGPIHLVDGRQQERIADEIDEQINWAAALEAALEATRTKADVLRRAVLVEACAGNLVAQDPDDEPASALLDRIRSERMAAQGGGSRRGMTRNTAP